MAFHSLSENKITRLQQETNIIPWIIQIDVKDQQSRIIFLELLMLKVRHSVRTPAHNAAWERIHSS